MCMDIEFLRWIFSLTSMFSDVLLAGLSYEVEFIQKILQKKKKPLAMAFSSTFRYIDDVLSINNNPIHSYVDSIYPNELEIKDTKVCSTSASYLDVSLKLDTNGEITTQIYDKRDDLIFSIVNFPYSSFIRCIYITAYSILVCKSFVDIRSVFSSNQSIL
jgi:hypothetical protein